MDLLTALDARKAAPVWSRDLSRELAYIEFLGSLRSPELIGIFPTMLLATSSRPGTQLRREILNNWVVGGLADIGASWAPYSSIAFTALRLSTSAPSRVFVARYLGHRTFRGSPDDSGLIGPQTPYPEYRDFLRAVDRGFCDRRLPERPTTHAHFQSLNSALVEPDHLTAAFYDPVAKLLEAAPDTRPLATFASVEKAYSRGRGSVADTISAAAGALSVGISSVSTGPSTSLAVQPGDLLAEPNLKAVSVVNNDVPPGTNAAAGQFVLRLHDEAVDPLALATYLRTPLVGDWLAGRTAGTPSPSINAGHVKAIPVVVLPTDLQRHLVSVEKSALLGVRSLDEFHRVMQQLGEAEQPTVLEQQMVAELLDATRVAKLETVQRVIISDLRELKIGLHHGLHKAFVVLAGSVAEAILLDWLSDATGKNYFSKRDYGLGLAMKRLQELGELSDEQVAQLSVLQKARNLIHPGRVLTDSAVVDRQLCAASLESLRMLVSARSLHSDDESA